MTAPQFTVIHNQVTVVTSSDGRRSSFPASALQPAQALQAATASPPVSILPEVSAFSLPTTALPARRTPAFPARRTPALPARRPWRQGGRGEEGESDYAHVDRLQLPYKLQAPTVATFQPAECSRTSQPLGLRKQLTSRSSMLYVNE